MRPKSDWKMLVSASVMDNHSLKFQSGSWITVAGGVVGPSWREQASLRGLGAEHLAEVAGRALGSVISAE